ncbi:hypothetical protein KFE25_008225 [Diacronema lutheri]|uniref:RING-CH-type domain-containing protein n=2 Tax=Diacronema lutheri TaxID=2081491 RepID=A0A8J5XNW2_DIALT|nr:hypothetical protein KFE25_008225 [Diacronema lutheri]
MSADVAVNVGPAPVLRDAYLTPIAPVVAIPPAAPLARASGASDVACVICLDEEAAAGGDPMLTNLCACKTTGMHRECLSRLINSRARRKLALADRTRCPVCNEPLRAPLACTAMAQPARPAPPRSYAMGFAVGLALLFGAQLFAKIFGSQLVFLSGALVAAIALIVAALRARKPAPVALTREHELDEETFYTRVVQVHRASLATRRLSVEAARAVPSTLLVLHIADCAPSAAKDPPRAAARAVAAAPVLPSADGMPAAAEPPACDANVPTATARGVLPAAARAHAQRNGPQCEPARG